MSKKQPVTVFHHFRHPSRGSKSFIAVLMSVLTAGTGLQAQGPSGGVVRAGNARVSGEGTSSTRIDQTSDRAIIDWRNFGIGAGDQVIFVQPSATSATLNRVTGEQVSVILGQLDANGQVLLINPNGIVFGGGAQVNVGSLIATTSNISDTNFMAGRLEFDAPGRPGAGVLNTGAITAAEGGLVALVAPHVRNDGVIVARLGKVVLGAADTFTIDLYGDALINLALSDGNVNQLRTADGQPVTSLVTNTGHIETAGGQTVLMTARNAKNVLDNLINMSGTIKADTAVQQGGRILLLGEGGKVGVTGAMSAQGESGGSIQVLGDRVRLGASASLDASGANGGGSIQAGGAYQGSGDTYRSTQTAVDAGATLKANALGTGNGGEVVVWSDGHTQFAGAVEAKGGANGGNGGTLEVSGKGTLDFLGQADASAAVGKAGSLLLDPEFLNIGAAEASTITRVLRTGTTATLQADIDINVNSAIFPGDRESGGGLNMTAGQNIHVNDYIVTDNGAITMTATNGTVTVAAGKAVFAGNAPITVNAGGTLHTGPLVTTGALAIQSITGSVAIDAFIDDHTGPVSIKAAGTVDINQPIVNMASGAPLTVTAGTDINVNAQVDGRGGVEGGPVTMTATRDLNVNQAIVTNNGAIALTATNGAINRGANGAIVSGTAPLTLTAQGNITTGGLSAGSLTLNSSQGDITIADAILNGQTGGSFTVTSARDVNVNAVIDGRGGVPGGAVNLTAARNLNVNEFILTNDGPINLTATSGTMTVAAGKGTSSGTAPTTMRSAGTLTTGVVSAGTLSATSTGGSVLVNGAIDGATGRVDLIAASDVVINAAVLNGRTGAAFNATGRDVIVNAAIDGRGGAGGGAVSLEAARNVAINNAVVTNNGGIGIAAVGAATMAPGAALASGTAAIAMTAGGDITTQGISGGSLAARSTAGSVLVGGVIDGSTGRVDLTAARNVTVNAPVLNLRTGAALTATAGQDVIVNTAIDGRGGAVGGAVSLQAAHDVLLNSNVVTSNGGIGVTAGNAVTMAAGTALASGTAAIGMTAGGDITTRDISGGSLSARSTAGSVLLAGVIDGSTGGVSLTAAKNVTVNGPVLNGRTGAALNATAGQDVVVNAAIDARGGAAGGAVSLQAAHDVLINTGVVTNNGGIGVTAGNAVTMAAGTALASGSGAIAMTAGGDITARDISGGSLAATSTTGSVLLAGVIDGSTGAVNLTAAKNVTVNAPVLNLRTGAALNATAGQDIAVNAQIDGTGGVAGGSVNLTAARDVNLAAPITTNNGAIRVSATTGAATVAPASGLFAGSGAITLDALGAVSTGILNGGVMNVTSRGGAVTVTGQMTGTGGAMTIGAAGQVTIAQAITNPGLTSPLTVTAGTNINVNAAVGRTGPGVASSAVTLSAGQNVSLNKSIETENGAISVTATNGTVTTAAGEGLFAGSGAIAIVSGQTLNTGTVNTTGAVSFRSTGGAVNVNTPINPATGAVTINAATDVNVNQGIANPRTNAALNVTAGHDINVNAKIDGRDNVLPGPSGTVTLTAANDIDVNEDITTVNSALSLTATAGAVTTAAGKGLFAGSGPISVTSGATLNTGITSTTGALTFRSTNGGVNVNTAIDDTTGDVSITAGTIVNINQEITNLKTGSQLVITAGTDINVLAKVDGRNGAAAGGTVAMTAGSNLNVTQAISTNNGAVSLTATNGSVVVPVGTEVTAPVYDPPTNTTPTQIISPMQAIIAAGSGAVNITSGGNFTLTSPVKTTGALTITSTNGNVTTAAPIGQETGAVTLTAHNALVLNREVKSNSQAITLNAGAGGITIPTITDYDYTNTSPVNPLIANLTLNSGGDVTITDIRGITSQQTVSIDARGQIVSGSIGYSTSPGLLRPQVVNLNADGGIVTFSTGHVGEVNATSSGGSINLIVENPGKLRVTTGTPGTTDCPTCNITVTSGLGLSPDAVFNAGGSIIMPRFFSTGTVDFTARSGDIDLDKSIVDGTFTGVAGRDVLLNALVWMGNSPLNPPAGGPLSFTAGRNIVQAATAEIHVSNAQTMTFLANHDLTLGLLETLGAVNLTATTGNITLNNDIGPHIFNTLSPATPDFNPTDKGVASLTMSAPAATAVITMQGARAEGNVVITTGGSLTAAKQITSVGGSVTITTGGSQTLSAVPIGTQNQVLYPAPVAPAVPPGPQSPLPTAPGVAANVAAGLPAFAEIPVGAADQIVGGPSQPGASTATVGLGAAPTAGIGLPGAPTGTIGLPGAASLSSGPGGGTGGGSNTRPNPPNGQGVAQADGSSDPRTIDSAAALRTVGESCGEENGKGDTGLDQAAPNTTATAATTTATATTAQKKTADTGEQKNATCKPAAAAGAGTQ